MLNLPPTQSRIIQENGLVGTIWARWFSAIQTQAVTKVYASDIEITDSAKGLILTSPNGNRWRVTVSNAGLLVVTAA